jgi:ribonuclease BN (tRNA processing enzyme)
LLVMSHLVPGELDVTDADWLNEAKKTFKGRIIVARDLMELKLPL